MPLKSQKSVASEAFKKPARPSSLRRTTRSGVKAMDRSVAEESSSASESQEDNDDDDEASDDDAEDADTDEPEELAPSRSTRRKTSHRTGLSHDFSNTGIGHLHSKKRTMSDSSEASIVTRPIKQPKLTEANATEAVSLTGDEGYDEVAAITDSEIEYSAVEQAETDLVIQDEQDRWRRGLLMDGGLEDSAFEEQYARTHPSEVNGFYGANDGTVSAPPEETPARRVRFAGIDSDSSSGTTSTSDIDNTFPDLLAHELQYSRQELEIPEDDDDGSSESFWDLDPNNPYAEEDRRLAELGFYEEPDNSSSSGYETDSDDGTTTEEEPEPLHSVSLPKKMLELRSNSPMPDGLRSRRLGMPRTRPAASAKGKGPILGTWIADPSKPIAIIDKSGGLKYYHVPSKTFGAMSSQVSSVDSSPQRSFVPLARPISAGGASQTGSIFDGDANQLTHMAGSDFLSSDAFLPMELEEAALFDEFEDDDDVSDTLDITDIIDFGDDSSDNGKGSDSESLQTPAKQFPTPKLPKITPKQSADRPSSHNLLEHFDRSGSRISAFRRNQTRTAHFGRWPASGLLAIKGGRHNMANNPISPVRKRKLNRSMSQVSSPLNGVNTKQRYIATVGGIRNRKNTL